MSTVAKTAPASEEAGVEYPLGELPVGELVDIVPLIRVMLLPVPFPPGSITATILEDEDGWSIVDTGWRNDETKALWREVLAGPLAAKPVKRIIATHHHPDHIGLAGWFMRDYGAALWTTRTAWLFARMMQLDAWETPPPESELFYRRCGYDADRMTRWRKRAATNFSVTVEPLPLGYRRIAAGERITAANRSWRVLTGNGHAPEHALLFAEAENLVIAGDQILPTITPNLGVYPTEPEADPIGEWLESCARLADEIDDHTLVIPGHGQPFRRARTRLKTVIGKHERALDRLAEYIAEPRKVVDCFSALYRREITAGLEGLATVESLAHLNHLWHHGRASRHLRADGVYEWKKLDV